MMLEDSEWLKNPSALFVGADEVGRGALAGPIVGCACVLKRETIEEWRTSSTPIILRDSKKMTAPQREVAAVWLQHHTRFMIQELSPLEIDAMGIQAANKRVLQEAIQNLLAKPGPTSHNVRIIVDHMPLELTGNHPVYSLPQAESQSLAVAAASILAKTHRDALMTQLAQLHPSYGWEANKGYGTAHHLQAIIQSGATPYHRKTFLTKFIVPGESS